MLDPRFLLNVRANGLPHERDFAMETVTAKLAGAREVLVEVSVDVILPWQDQPPKGFEN